MEAGLSALSSPEQVTRDTGVAPKQAASSYVSSDLGHGMAGMPLSYRQLFALQQGAGNRATSALVGPIVRSPLSQRNGRSRQPDPCPSPRRLAPRSLEEPSPPQRIDGGNHGTIIVERRREAIPGLPGELAGAGDKTATAQRYPEPAGPATPAWGPGAPAAQPMPGSAPADPVPAAWSIASHSEVPAPDGTPDTRTTIGVCETIGLDAGGEVVDWSANKGQPKAGPGTARFLWAAPDVGGMATITATHPVSGVSRSIEITVVPPTVVQYKKISDQALPPGTIGAVMKLEGTVLPKNVTFGWITVKEDPGPRPIATGYFRRLRRRFGVELDHGPNKKFVHVNWDNHFCCDIAGIKGPWPTPRGPGTVRWLIPTRYRCEWSTTGTGHIFTQMTQDTSIDATGKVTVTKDGASITRPSGK